MSNRYRDRYNNVLPAPRERISAKPEQSENPSKINADYYCKLWMNQGGKFTDKQHAEVIKLVISKWATQVDRELRTMEFDDNPDFSLDEAIGIAVLASLTGLPETLSKIRIYKYGIRFYDVVPFLLLMKYPKLKYFGVLQLMVYTLTPLSCVFGFLKKFPYFGVLPDSDTSGRCLAYLKCVGLRSSLMMKACEFLMKLKGVTFKSNYAFYYGYWDSSSGVRLRISYEDQPVNLLWK